MMDTAHDLQIGAEVTPGAELAGRDTAGGGYADSGKSQTKQWAIAGVLLLVLIGVVWWGPASELTSDNSGPAALSPVSKVSCPETEPCVGGSPEDSKGEGRRDRGVGVAAGSDQRCVDWTARRQLPEMDLEAALAVDPFGPLQLPGGDSAVPSRVKAVYGDRRGKAALVGGNVVRIGQPLPDGRKVIDISPRGVAIGR